MGKCFTNLTSPCKYLWPLLEITVSLWWDLLSRHVRGRDSFSLWHTQKGSFKWGKKFGLESKERLGGDYWRSRSVGFTLNLVVAEPMSLADVELLEAKTHGIHLSVSPFPVPNATHSTNVPCFEMDAFLSQVIQTKQLCVLGKNWICITQRIISCVFPSFSFWLPGKYPKLQNSKRMIIRS